MSSKTLDSSEANDFDSKCSEIKDSVATLEDSLEDSKCLLEPEDLAPPTVSGYCHVCRQFCLRGLGELDGKPNVFDKGGEEEAPENDCDEQEVTSSMENIAKLLGEKDASFAQNCVKSYEIEAAGICYGPCNYYLYQKVCGQPTPAPTTPPTCAIQ